MCQKVWVLTREVNAYDQEGEYFVAVFASKPTLKTLAEHFKSLSTDATNVMDAVAFLEHLRTGGGRRGTEHEWYNLSEVKTL